MFEENTQKSAKSVAWILIALSALLAATQYSRSIDKIYPTRTFSVDGEATVDLVPDVAKFSVSVVTDGGNDVTSVQQENAKKMDNVTSFLADSGVEKKDLKTDTYNLVPRYSTPNCLGLSVCPPASIVGYSLNQTVRVTVRDKSKIGDLLSGCVSRGANSVTEVTFTVDDEDAHKTAARKEAIEKAQEKAVEIARDAGFSIGKLVSIYETQPMMGYGGGGDYDARESGSVMKSAIAPDIQPGTNESKVTMTLTYEIR